MSEYRSGPGRWTGASLAVLSLIPALISWSLFSGPLPDEIRRYEDYTAAPPCADSTGDCIRTLPLAVDHTVVKKGKGGKFEATLSGQDSRKIVVLFGDPGPLLAQLEPRDQVTATVWRGRVMAVTKGDVRQSSADEPRDDAQMTAGLGTFAGLVAALGLAFAIALLAGLGGRQPWTWRALGMPLLIGSALTCLAVAVPALLIGLPWWVVPGVTVPFVAYAAWQLHRYRQRQQRSDRVE
ncbi:hypothetical protein OG311_21600 [Streptomyces sp. NBC_01343]|uniref:hypothetical protein n=1 Tax=Streptomyces sp. NBC_01343 TaxID=2903832 RepID=UPI002E163442|nr:hypothetical protein OG311_21600 [Streptomyces sp. NBC_01343]